MSWLSHEVHVVEAEGLRFVANNLIAPNETKINAFFEGKAPQAADALVTLVESDDQVLGPIASALINSTLNGYKPQIETEFALIATEGASYAATLVTAMNNVATKLAAN